MLVFGAAGSARDWLRSARRSWWRAEPQRILLVVPPVDVATKKRRWDSFAAATAAAHHTIPKSDGTEMAAGFDAAGACRVVSSGIATSPGNDYRRAVLSLADPGLVEEVIVGVSLWKKQSTLTLVSGAAVGFVLPALMLAAAVQQAVAQAPEMVAEAVMTMPIVAIWCSLWGALFYPLRNRTLRINSTAKTWSTAFSIVSHPWVDVTEVAGRKLTVRTQSGDQVLVVPEIYILACVPGIIESKMKDAWNAVASSK